MNTLKNHIHKFYGGLAAQERIVDTYIDGMTEEAYTQDFAYTPDSDNEVAFAGVLTPDELRIVKLKEQGYKHREIADMMKVKPGTIDSKVSRIKDKVIILEGKWIMKLFYSGARF